MSEQGEARTFTSAIIIGLKYAAVNLGNALSYGKRSHIFGILVKRKNNNNNSDK